MRATYHNTKKDTSKGVIRIYKLSGTKEELAEYKKAKEATGKENYITLADGTPLYFTQRPLDPDANYKLNGAILEDSDGATLMNQLLKEESQSRGITLEQLVLRKAKIDAGLMLADGTLLVGNKTLQAAF